MKVTQKVVLNANDFVTFTNDVKNLIDKLKLANNISKKDAELWKLKVKLIERLAEYS